MEMEPREYRHMYSSCACLFTYIVSDNVVFCYRCHCQNRAISRNICSHGYVVHCASMLCSRKPAAVSLSSILYSIYSCLRAIHVETDFISIRIVRGYAYACGLHHHRLCEHLWHFYVCGYRIQRPMLLSIRTHVLYLAYI